MNTGTLKTPAIWLLMAMPFLAYLWMLFTYTVNVPYYDDITQIVWICNTIIDQSFESPWVSERDHPDIVHALFYPNAGHIPLLTRLFALLQYAMGGMDFRITILAGNAGWIATCLLFIAYARKEHNTPWAYLLPFPFLMMAITHWEAMDFALPAWQMYWGGCFFPAAMLLAAYKRRIVLTIVCFFGALFVSGGSQALYPVTVAYLLWRRRWLHAVIFGIAGAGLWALFLHFNPPAPHVQHEFPSLMLFTKYVLAFLGNTVSTGAWDLSAYTVIHVTLGVLLIVAFAAYFLWGRHGDFPKLVFLYLGILAAMAAYMRSGAYVVPRYSMFALLAFAALYLQVLEQHRPGKRLQVVVGMCTLLTVAFWAHSLKVDQAPLAQNRSDRLNGAHKFIETGDASSLMWHNEWGGEILREAKHLGLYDYESVRDTQP